MIFDNDFSTPENLGNILYGYAGTAFGFSEIILLGGSIFASGVYKPGATNDSLTSEWYDHGYIREGIQRYYNS